jgi:hypothetical protein
VNDKRGYACTCSWSKLDSVLSLRIRCMYCLRVILPWFYLLIIVAGRGRKDDCVDVSATDAALARAGCVWGRAGVEHCHKRSSHTLDVWHTFNIRLACESQRKPLPAELCHARAA